MLPEILCIDLPFLSIVDEKVGVGGFVGSWRRNLIIGLCRVSANRSNNPESAILMKQHTPGETASLSCPSLTARRHTVGADDGRRGRVGRPLRPKPLQRLGFGITKKSASASDLQT